MGDKNLILINKQIQHQIKHIALEKLEQVFKETEVVVAGIYNRRYTFTKPMEKEFAALKFQ